MSPSETIVGLGARTDYLAQVPNVDPSRLRLTPEEGQLFSAVGRAARIDELIQRSGLDEPRAIALLLSLRAKGAVTPARVNKPQQAVHVDAAMSEEVDLPPERKKEILDLDRALDALNMFEVLGLRPGATPEEAKQAYYAASRRYHPDRYFGKNLGSFKSRIDKIFRRLTEAYNTLSDADKRAAYLKLHPHLASPPPEAGQGNVVHSPAVELDPARAAERRARMARHPYLLKNNRVLELITRAKDQMARGAPGVALTDLHLAAQLDPQNKEIQLLQTDARRKHDVHRAAEEVTRGDEAEQQGDLPAALNRFKTAATVDPQSALAAHKAARAMYLLNQELPEAIVMAQRAVELDRRNVDARVLLGALLLRAGDSKKLAKKYLEEALAMKPDHAEAKMHLKKMRWPF